MSTTVFNRTVSNSARQFGKSNLTRNVLIGAGAGLVGTYLYQQNNNGGNKLKYLTAAAPALKVASTPTQTIEDYQKIYNDIAAKIEENLDYDDGAGPFGLLVRLSWHLSGTYVKKTNQGGSYGGTMVYNQEAFDGANNGLAHGRDFLNEFQYKYPFISRGDLWTLGGVVAVQEAGGPKIKWRPGRENTDVTTVAPNGLLPDAAQGAKHLRNVFYRMGFNDQEITALIGAHCLGKTHIANSGYEGPWGPSPNMFTNDFFVRLLQKWSVRKWDGPKQYEDNETKSFMMLPADIALKEDSAFLKHVKRYAASEEVFFKEFSVAFATLLELGVAFPKSSKPFEFKTVAEQEE